MDRQQKAAVIDEVAGQISGSEAVYAVDYRGISVPDAADLRTRLRDADTSFASSRTRSPNGRPTRPAWLT
jgi:large subunit ribosomal protein L10